MNKAEVLAREIYPDWELTNNPRVDGVEQSEVRIQRAAFVEGYRQAEKDLVLTWEDIKKIDVLIYAVLDEEKYKRYYMQDGDGDFYEEVLKRFNKERKEK